jgi:SAM-dependent methyltransferase
MAWRAAKIRLATVRPALLFRGSGRYWEARYAAGGTSGSGSYGAQAEYKASFLNRFVADRAVQTVVELGCGDGNQLRLADYPRYLGLDVSRTAIERCTALFREDPSKSFAFYEPTLLEDPAGFLRGELALSLDVVYHLVEDDVFDRYMRQLTAAAERYVIVYASDDDRRVAAPHVRHRRFGQWMEEHAPSFRLTETVPRPDPSYQDFFVFERIGA